MSWWQRKCSAKKSPGLASWLYRQRLAVVAADITDEGWDDVIPRLIMSSHWPARLKTDVISLSLSGSMLHIGDRLRPQSSDQAVPNRIQIFLLVLSIVWNTLGVDTPSSQSMVSVRLPGSKTFPCTLVTCGYVPALGWGRPHPRQAAIPLHKYEQRARTRHIWRWYLIPDQDLTDRRRQWVSGVASPAAIRRP